MCLRLDKLRPTLEREFRYLKAITKGSENYAKTRSKLYYQNQNEQVLNIVQQI